MGNPKLKLVNLSLNHKKNMQKFIPYIAGISATLCVGAITGNFIIAAKAGASVTTKFAVMTSAGALKGATGFVAKQVTSNVQESKHLTNNLSAYSMRGVVVGALGGFCGQGASILFHNDWAFHGGNLLVRFGNFIFEHSVEHHDTHNTKHTNQYEKSI